MSDKLQWPETVDQAVGVLLGLLPDGEKAKIAAMSVLIWLMLPAMLAM